MRARTCAAVLLLLILLACQTPPDHAGSAPAFDAARAFSHLSKQLEFGPRVPGSRGHSRCLDYILAHLGACTEAVKTQNFPIRCYPGQPLGTNVIAEFGDSAVAPILIGCHWDTRPVADRDPNPENRNTPIPGANDGASGVAVLLELAALMHINKPPKPVVLVFFDAEDMGRLRSCPFCMGSRFFASNIDSVLTRRPRFGVVVDMVGDSHLALPIEANSKVMAPRVAQRVWELARRAGYTEFLQKTGPFVFDDHIPLNNAGIPSILIIDFEYPFWHTLQDTLDKCSPESLKAVGDVLVALVYSNGKAK